MDCREKQQNYLWMLFSFTTLYYSFLLLSLIRYNVYKGDLFFFFLTEEYLLVDLLWFLLLLLLFWFWFGLCF